MMFYKARLAALTIKSGQPIMEIFGMKIGEEMPQFKRKDGVEQQRGLNQLALGGRRLYHSSAVATTPRPREEQDVFPVCLPYLLNRPTQTQFTFIQTLR